jgi:NAD dependent epimerase/dehydratase family enzyme
VPELALNLLLGEMANELLLASARVQPKKLLSSGYIFRYPNLEPLLGQLLS